MKAMKLKILGICLGSMLLTGCVGFYGYDDGYDTYSPSTWDYYYWGPAFSGYYYDGYPYFGGAYYYYGRDSFRKHHGGFDGNHGRIGDNHGGFKGNHDSSGGHHGGFGGGRGSFGGGHGGHHRGGHR